MECYFYALSISGAEAALKPLNARVGGRGVVHSYHSLSRALVGVLLRRFSDEVQGLHRAQRGGLQPPPQANVGGNRRFVVKISRVVIAFDVDEVQGSGDTRRGDVQQREPEDDPTAVGPRVERKY